MAKTKPASVRQSSSRPDQVGTMIYSFALAAFGLAALVPTARVWGINWWGYFPVWSIALWLLVGASLAFLSLRLLRTELAETGGGELSTSTYWTAGCLSVVTLTLLSIVFPASTHFSGDGYQLLSRLADGRSISKDWDTGSTKLIEWVHGLIGGTGKPGAIQTYQRVAFLSGVIASVGSLLLVNLVPVSRLHRLLILAGVLSGGYLLLFFGHVENYTPLVAVTMLYCLAGYLVSLGRLSLVWLFPLAGLAVFLHLIAVALIPSLVLLSLEKAGLLARMQTLISSRARMIFGVFSAVALIAYYLLQQNLLFLKFALLPVIPDLFAVDGEWLFSPKHLLDMFNLILLLAPMSVMLLTFPWRASKEGSSSSTRFIWTLVLGTLGMVFVMRSGLGMPRDWDLFAIAGPPLVLAVLVALLKWGEGKKWQLSLLALAVSLNILMLAPRIVVNVNADVSVQHFRSYLDLDFLRGRNARRLLVDYYRESGKVVAADQEQTRAEGDFPESRVAQQANSQLISGQYGKAAELYWRVIKINPLFSDAWANLGATYMSMNRLDSAYLLLEIANQINPNNLQTVNNLGVVSIRRGDYESAARWLDRTLQIDANYWRGLGNLSLLSIKTGRADDAMHYVRRIAAQEDAPADYLSSLGDSLLASGAPEKAVEVYGLAIAKGLDSLKVQALLARYPQLRK